MHKETPALPRLYIDKKCMWRREGKGREGKGKRYNFGVKPVTSSS
jgi:hypothetical protein